MSKIYVDEIQPKTSGGDISFGKLATIYPRGLTYYPAMLARKTSTYSSSSGAGYWICTNVTFDEGSNYDTSTGKFTAPIDGIYHVDFFLLGQDGDNYDIHLRKNDATYADYDMRNNNSALESNLTHGMSGLIKMDANDTCGIYVSSISNDIYGSGLNQLSIYLVTPV